MSTLRSWLGRLRGSAGWLGITLLMLPVLGWVWMAARGPALSVLDGSLPRWVMSGQWLTERFDIVHAGAALDQPTIGKWLFWFTVMTASSLPYAALVRGLADRRRRAARLALGLLTGALCFLLLCMVSWPLVWLFQYVWSMGLTPRRAGGLCYAIQGGWLVMFFLAWAVRTPGVKMDCTAAEPCPHPQY